MPFRPEVGDVLVIEELAYTFTQHPIAPGVPYGQTGRRATIYQLAAAGGLWALKVFTQAFIMPRLAEGTIRLRPFATLPGLSVCSRIVLTPQRCPDLLVLYPELRYAVLMAWVAGETWQELVAGQVELRVDQSRTLAAKFAHILTEMEARGIAHCDLSGPNIMVTLDPPSIALVDVEELYARTHTRPERLPAGSAGYAHRVAAYGLWQREADRFAMAVLLAEMLGWCDERVRDRADEEHFFAPEELQQDTPKARLMEMVLHQCWGEGIAALFARAWSSETLQNCPTAMEWLMAMNHAGPTTESTAEYDAMAREADALAVMPRQGSRRFMADWAASRLLCGVLRPRFVLIGLLAITIVAIVIITVVAYR